MSSTLRTALLAGLSVPFLVSTGAFAAGNAASDPTQYLAQSSTETGQSGVGVRGTTGENSGGGQTAPGSVGTQPGGGSGATGTEGQPRGTGGAGEATGGQGTDTGAGGAITTGQPPGGSENHVKEAVKHAEAAATSGKKGDASTIAKHAQMSKTHVEAALKDKPDDEHLKAALKSLDEAIGDANRGVGDKARKAAREAVTHLNAAK